MNNDRETKRHHWQQHVTNWKNSALTQRAFCEQYDLNLHQFGYWNKRFNLTQSSPPKHQDKNTPTKDTGFVSVKLSDADSPQVFPYLELPNGIRIHSIHHLPADYVTQLVNSLQ